MRSAEFLGRSAMKFGRYPKGVSAYDDQHGKRRVRARRTGWPTYYFKNMGVDTQAFWDEYRAWNEGASHRPEIGMSRTRAGSVSDLVARYYRSAEWVSLGKSTQATYRGIIERF